MTALRRIATIAFGVLASSAVASARRVPAGATA